MHLGDLPNASGYHAILDALFLILQYLVFLRVQVQVGADKRRKVSSRQKRPWQLQRANSLPFSSTAWSPCRVSGLGVIWARPCGRESVTSEKALNPLLFQRKERSWVFDPAFDPLQGHLPLIKFWCMLSCFSRSWLFLILWTLVHQACRSMGFSWQEHWSELTFPPPGYLPNWGI